ncbi:polysaccharide biosynthesis tyrosine autokinase [Maribacter sp. MJ134]|uniref:GumC family protein n=1 Tax=Maribacter sp. MJ134 TaxID=2496865 RepID=UPI000F842789|nr:polysaccharide biosynthesis tyrosine autokinase [Maribacter sp. MJ134]AZQ58461.1 polysaccharide biosynthesis tyrosine autokinase [Maribacter sp. MJ134]
MDSKGFLDSNIDINDLIKSYSRYWKWFLLSIICFIVGAFIFIRYATPEYAAKAKIHILEDKNSSSELSAFGDLGILGGSSNKVEDEIEILNSRSNFISVVNKLKLNLKLSLIGNVKSSEIYLNKPFKVNFLRNDSIVNNSYLSFFISPISESKFEFSDGDDENVVIHSFGKNISTDIGDIVLTPNIDYIRSYLGKKIQVELRPIFSIAENYQQKIVITPALEFSNIINISLNSPIKQKALDVINTLIEIYNQNAIEDKRIVADRTSNFIDERIKEISTNLSSVDQSAEEFKTEKGVNDIAAESNIALNVGAASRQNLENAKTQLNIAAGMNSYLSEEDGFEVLPSNVGLSDGSIANTTAKYNELVLERKRLLKSADEQNPIIVNLDQQLQGLKSTIQSSLSGMERNLGMQVNNLSSQMARINSKIYSAPKNSRDLRDITRKQETTESLYLYLLQKREESQITLASSTPKSKVIDNAHLVQLAPVTPKKPLIYLASLILAFLVPFSIIYTNQLLDNKVNNKADLEKLINDVPVLSELPSVSKNEELLIKKDDRSVLSESLRILRTNLDYLIKAKKDIKNNVIFVTSSVPGEGKTFVSSNLSMILSSTNKKVLLIGADIRNPKLYTFFAGKNVDRLGKPKRNEDAGLTEYLYDEKLTSKDIINTLLVHTNTIDVIYSGKIPPNPSELLMSDRIKELIEKVSIDYDYVVVDTAPLLVVTDTLLLTEYANHVLYVVRSGNTEKKVLQYPINLKKEGKLPSLAFVVNGVSSSNLGYGGKYGYGYGENMKKPWWKFS